jgi:hypothetical protein
VTRITALVAAALLLSAAACSASSPASTTPSASRQVAASRHEIVGGCGTTPIYRGGPPVWATPDTPADSPYVLSTSGNAVGFLFVDPLRAGDPGGGPNNKILWYVRLPRDGQALRATATPVGQDTPVVTIERPADSSPGEIYPSTLNVPTPGCWHVTLSWSTHTDSVDLSYLPR